MVRILMSGSQAALSNSAGCGADSVVSAAGEGFGVESLQIQNVIEEVNAEDGCAHPGLVLNSALSAVPQAATVLGRSASCGALSPLPCAWPSLRPAKVMAARSQAYGR
jgi:hypothetical protein